MLEPLGVFLMAGKPVIVRWKWYGNAESLPGVHEHVESALHTLKLQGSNLLNLLLSKASPGIHDRYTPRCSELPFPIIENTDWMNKIYSCIALINKNPKWSIGIKSSMRLHLLLCPGEMIQTWVDFQQFLFSLIILYFHGNGLKRFPPSPRQWRKLTSERHQQTERNTIGA